MQPEKIYSGHTMGMLKIKLNKVKGQVFYENVTDNQRSGLITLTTSVREDMCVIT
jgi:hypothetical protein